MENITQTPEQTKQLGQAFSQKLQPGSVIALYGELGGGKTTFIQGVLEGLGISQRVTSPTFVLLKMYTSPQKTTIFHFDLYRMNTIDEAKALGIEEVLHDANAITFIEWPEKVAELLPKTTHTVRFEKCNETERKIVIDGED